METLVLILLDKLSVNFRISAEVLAKLESTLGNTAESSPRSVVTSVTASMMASVLPVGTLTLRTVPPEGFPRASFDWLLDLDEAVGVLQLGLALLAEIEIRALIALVSNACQGILSASIASDVPVNDSFRSDWCRFNLSALQFDANLVDDARKQVVDLFGNQLVQLLTEEFLSWEWASFGSFTIRSTGKEGWLEASRRLETSRERRRLVVSSMVTASFPPLAATSVSGRFFLFLLDGLLDFFFYFFHWRVDFLNLGFHDDFRLHRFDLFSWRLNRLFDWLGNFSYDLHRLDFGNADNGYVSDNLNLRDGLDLNLRLDLLFGNRSNLRFSNRLILESEDIDLDEFLSAGSIEGMNILVVADADVVSISIAIGDLEVSRQIFEAFANKANQFSVVGFLGEEVDLLSERNLEIKHWLLLNLLYVLIG